MSRPVVAGLCSRYPGTEVGALIPALLRMNVNDAAQQTSRLNTPGPPTCRHLLRSSARRRRADMTRRAAIDQGKPISRSPQGISAVPAELCHLQVPSQFRAPRAGDTPITSRRLASHALPPIRPGDGGCAGVRRAPSPILTQRRVPAKAELIRPLRHAAIAADLPRRCLHRTPTPIPDRA